MRHVVHVHQQKLRNGEPCIIDRTYRGSTHHRELTIPAGAKIIQSDTPDRCGARVWIEWDE